MRAVLIAIAIARVVGVSSPRARGDAPAPLIPVEAPDSEYPDPLASLTHRFSLAQPGSDAGKAPLPKWLEKPPWWLPTPPEWGPPPAHMYGSWYDPRNIPQPVFRANPRVWRSGFYGSGSVSGGGSAAPSPFGWNGGAFAPQLLPPYAGSYVELGEAGDEPSGTRNTVPGQAGRGAAPGRRHLRGGGRAETGS